MTDKLPLVVRNVPDEDGTVQGVLFTMDGKEIGHQVKSEGHYWYKGHGKERRCYYRATFAMDGMEDSGPE